jgi:hypothetical protein
LALISVELKEHVVRFLLAILFLGSTSIAVAQGVPKINIEPSCRAAAKGSGGLTQDFASCRGSEEAARDILVKQWKNFPVADRNSCHRLTTTGTPGTYTELLTCLEMRRDARGLREPDKGRKKLSK